MSLFVGAFALAACQTSKGHEDGGGGDGSTATCGNGTCEAAETCASCASDCGACSSHSVALNWNASTTAGVTYNLYRGTATGGPYSSLQTALSTTSATDAAVKASTKYFYVVRAANSAGESANSNEIEADIP
jgi:mannan endo-1,4-beta-mannosidase